MTIKIVVEGVEIHFPDNTPSEEIAAGAAQVRAALKGQGEAAQGGMNMGPSQAMDHEPAPGPSRTEAFGTAVGKGVSDITTGLGITDRPSIEQRQEYRALEKQYPWTTMAGEIAGESAPFALAGGIGGKLLQLSGQGLRYMGLFAKAAQGAEKGVKTASKLRRAGQVAGSAGLGGAEAGIEAKGEGKTLSEAGGTAGIGASIAAAADLALPPMGRGAMKVFRKVFNRAPRGSLVVNGVATAEFLELLNRLGLEPDDVAGPDAEKILLEAVTHGDPEAATRKAFLDGQGFVDDAAPTKAQVTRKATDWQEMQEAAKTGDQIRGRISNQNALIRNKLDDATEGTGGELTTGSPVFDHVLNKSTVHDNRISDMYKAADDALGGEPGVSPQELLDFLSKNDGEDQLTNGLLSSISKLLEKTGVTDETGAVVRDMTVREAEGIVKNINLKFSPGNKFSNYMGSQMKDVVDDSVTMAGGSDLYRQARKEKARFHQELSRSSASKFSKRKVSLVRDILEEGIDPNDLLEKGILSKKYRASDIADLKKYLHSGDPSEVAFGKAAWDDLRAEAMDFLKNNSLGGAEDELGFQAISRYRFEKSLNKFGEDKLKILFEPEELSLLQDIVKITKMLEPLPGTQQGKGPSAQAIESLKRRLSSQPVIGLLFDPKIDKSGKYLMAKPSPVYKPSIVRAEGAAAPVAAAAFTGEDEEE